MDDYFLSESPARTGLDLEIRRNRFKGVKRTEKINILSILILVLAMGLFFSAYGGRVFARAEQPKSENVAQAIADPMDKIKSHREEDEKKVSVKICLDEPLAKPADQPNNKGKKEENSEQSKYLELVSGSPMEEMVPYISKRDKKTASFLVAIAKKESDWGRHSPRKDGRDCHNYWGYKGGYNLVQGYSCFDSAEQAVEVVGNRIEQLIGKNIDTPQKMLVWKCGGNCAGDKGAASWVGTVSGYFNKLTS